jgi:hypothetical protein
MTRAPVTREGEESHRRGKWVLDARLRGHDKKKEGGKRKEGKGRKRKEV